MHASHPSQPAVPEWTRTAIIAVIAAALVVTLSMGVRQSFGLLMQPVGRELGITREAFAFTIAAQNLLFGLVQPFVGALTDRYGPRTTLIGGTLVYAVGLAVAALATNAFGIGLGLGFFVGLAMSGTTFVVALGAVGRIVPAEHRSTAFGIVTAGGSLGQFAVVPAAQLFITNFGWRGMLFASAVLVLVNLIAAFGFRMPKAVAAPANSPPPQRLRAALDAAARHPHYWLLNGGFFVCGFHVAFVGTHLPAYLVDGGLDVSIGAWSLALIGLFNIVGSYLFGVWGGRYSRPGLLAALYAARGVALVAFIAVPLSPASALLFAAAFGFLWLGTVPLTNGAVASMFGVTHLSTLAGVVFFSHQVGAFLGAWFGGMLFDRTGRYDLVWYASIALAVLAAILSAMTRDTPVRAPALAAA